MGNVENLPLSGSQCFKIFDCGSYVAVVFCIFNTLYFLYVLIIRCIFPWQATTAAANPSLAKGGGQGRGILPLDGGGGLYVVQVINTNFDACINVNININIIISLHVDFNQILTFVARESSHARHKYNEAKLIIIIITLLQNLYIIYDHGTIIVADIESQFKQLRVCS